MAHKIKINDQVIEYDLIQRQIKYPRLEFKTGKLRLILPKNYRNHEHLIEKHKLWIWRRHCEIQAVLRDSENRELDMDRTDNEFKHLVHSCIERMEKELNVSVNQVRFRRMKTKWGSCSCRGNLNFNTYLKYLPENLIEYVVYHEMVHLIELKHNDRFWGFIHDRYEDRREHEKSMSSYWFLIQKMGG